MSVLLDEMSEVAGRFSVSDRFETVDGETVEVREMSFYSAEVANTLRDRLQEYATCSGLGRTRSDMLFHVPLPEDRTRNRRPDVAFITFDRWPLNRPLAFRENAGDVVPDLVAEVASPTDAADDLFDKAEEYLKAGVRVVWLVIPRTKVGFIYEPDRDPRAVRVAGELDGGNAFPDLRIAMAGLFPEVAVDI